MLCAVPATKPMVPKHRRKLKALAQNRKKSSTSVTALPASHPAVTVCINSDSTVYTSPEPWHETSTRSSQTRPSRSA